MKAGCANHLSSLGESGISLPLNSGKLSRPGFPDTDTFWSLMAQLALRWCHKTECIMGKMDAPVWLSLASYLLTYVINN